MKPNTTPDIKQKAANRLRACLDTHPIHTYIEKKPCQIRSITHKL